MTRREKYTLKTIKQTAVYQANIEAVKAIYPGHEEDFARELVRAANSTEAIFKPLETSIFNSFLWHETPQGYNYWQKIDWQIVIHNAEKAAA